jgi:hypothetical protein
MIQVKMISDLGGYKTGNSYYFADDKAISFLNNGVASYQDSTPKVVQVTMVVDYGNFKTGQTYFMLEPFDLLNSGKATYATQKQLKSAVALNAVSSQVNLAKTVGTIVPNAVGATPADKYYVLVGLVGEKRSVISDEIVVSQGASTTKLTITFTGTFDSVLLYQGAETGVYTKAVAVESLEQISATITDAETAYATIEALDIEQVTSYSVYGVVGKTGDKITYNGNLYFLNVDNTVLDANWIEVAKSSDVPTVPDALFTSEQVTALLALIAPQ